MTIESPVQVDRKCSPSKKYDNYLREKISAFFWHIKLFKG